MCARVLGYVTVPALLTSSIAAPGQAARAALFPSPLLLA
jgi:hypothetical protein